MERAADNRRIGRVGSRRLLGALGAAFAAAAIGICGWLLLKPEPSFDEFLDEAFVEMLEHDRMLLWMAGDPASFGLERKQGAEPSGSLIDLSPKAKDSYAAIISKQLKQLNAYDPEKLDEDDRLTYALLQRGYNDILAMEQYRTLAAGDSLHALLVLPANYTSYYPITDMQSARAYMNNLLAFPEVVNGLMETLDARRAEGVPYARLYLEYTLGELNRLIYTDSREDPFYLHLQAWMNAADGNVADEQRIAEELRAVLETAVYPSVEHLKQYIREYLLPDASDDISLSAYPGGRGYYAELVRQMTGTKMTPDEVHELAVKRAAEMYEAIQALPGEEWIAYSVAVRDVVRPNGALDAIAELQAQMYARLPRAFEDAMLPDAELQYREANFTDSLYRMGSIDDSRDGIVLISRFQLPDRLTFRNLAYHEGLPGHHLQLFIQSRSERIPNIRKLASNPGYTEGWAVYADSKAAEDLGMLDTGGARFAQLANLRYRFASIAIDTGIHWLGWTEEEAQRYLRSIGMGARAPMEYYAAYPGRLLAYGIGYEQFAALRGKAEAELGDAFDLRTFHTAVLENGSMPFDMLERQVDRYIERVRSSAAASSSRSGTLGGPAADM